MFVPPAMVLGRGTSLINTLRNLDLLTNLKVCLDAGDLNSWPGSGQLWKDLSGNGNDFYRGSGSGSDGADPTGNGSAGNMSSAEYFSYDGGDYFTLGQSAPSWQSAFHKAGAAFTIAGWSYLSGITSTSPTKEFFGFGDADSPSTGPDAFGVGASGSLARAIGVAITNASSTIYALRSDAQANNDAWNFLAASFDITAGNTIFQINSTTETHGSQSFSGTPSSTDSHVPLVIGAHGAGGRQPDSSGCRIGSVAIFSAGLSSANLASIYNATKSKYGL